MTGDHDRRSAIAFEPAHWSSLVLSPPWSASTRLLAYWVVSWWLADKKVRLVNVAPGAIATPSTNFVLDDPEAEHAVEPEIPLGHFGQPEQIAAAVAWAASDQADYVTGTTIVVDGGMSLYQRFV